MLARISWPVIVRYALLAIAAACCLFALAVLADSKIRWPSGPYAAFRLHALADLATALTCLGVSAAAAIHNARRIGRGETLWRAPAALAGGVGIFVAMLSVWLLGEMAAGLIAEPVGLYDLNWLVGFAVAPLLALAATAGWLLLAVSFGARPPSGQQATKLLLRVLGGSMLAAGLACLMAATQAKEPVRALLTGAPMAFGLYGLAAAAMTRSHDGGPALVQASAGYVGGSVASLCLSAAVAGWCAAYDPLSAFFYPIVMIPVGLALVAAYGVAVLIAAGRVADCARRLRRALA